MPQVCNRSVTQHGTGARFLSTVSLMSEAGKRTVKMRNSVERNLQEMKVRRLNHLASQSDRTEQRLRARLRQSLRRIIAYRKVTEERCAARDRNYSQSLNWSYSEDGMKHDIARVLHDTHPETIRKRKEQVTVEQNRERYAVILRQSKANLSEILSPSAEPKRDQGPYPISSKAMATIPRKETNTKIQLEKVESGVRLEYKCTHAKSVNSKAPRELSAPYVTKINNSQSETNKPNELPRKSKGEQRRATEPKYKLPPLVLKKANGV